MPYILNIETSTKNCSVSVTSGKELVCLCEEYDENYSHSQKLHKFIKWALEGAEIEMNQLNAVCVSKGPGSYTGLRIGVSAAKGLCYALNIPLLSVESLDILSYMEDLEEYDVIVPMLDARRKEVYTKSFNAKKEEIAKTKALILDEDSFLNFQEKKVLFIGDGAEKAKEILKNENASFRYDVYPSAKFMAKLSYEKYLQKEFEDVAYFEPFYLKDFIAGKPKQKTV